ncbi:mannan endo-1,4-beta-mannosidase 1-like isoform X2 [Salvia miltiorrhiza]|uniref:mannan endo-1,4-beta-mannosidase 1-like isoform X2 n=1 Tax=Salvia miltiorrhiza TaxID=226208 RepID=UPI0025ABEFBE|nr:mannan endo-1,4-beta-mannosidase 1-like isoform X2 [Salvia miltiorrhiza]
MGSTSILTMFMFILLGGLACQGRKVPSNLAFVGSNLVVQGSPFLFNGFNAYWMMHVAADPDDRHKVSDVFRQASAAGLTVCRTWAFADGGDAALQISPGTYDERVFQGLDFVISEATKYGIRLILSFVNNFDEFGGKAQYAEWARNAGAQVDGDDDFYTNPLIKDYYKNHIRRVVTRLNSITGVRYRDEPTIMAWELINEPRCQTDLSGATITGWVEEMARFVKSIDNKHLVEIGMEGFYGDTMPQRKQVINPGYQIGTDFISSNLVQEIDFATIHAYPDAWLPGKSEDEQMDFMERWMWSHWEDARNILKKPLVIAEFGKSSKYGLHERDLYMRDVYRDIYRYATSGGTMSGSLVWQVMAEGMDQYYDGYQIVLSQNPSTARIISRQSRAMNGLMSRLFTNYNHRLVMPHHHATIITS